MMHDRSQLPWEWEMGNAFATRQLALLATRIAFCNILAWACTENQNFGREGDLRL